MLYVSHLVLYVYSYMSNVVNLYVRFSCKCIYCLYLCRRQKCLNHSAIHLICLYMSSSCVIHVYVISYVVNLYVCLTCICPLYLSWRHGRTAPWPSCLSRLKNRIKKMYVCMYVCILSYIVEFCVCILSHIVEFHIVEFGVCIVSHIVELCKFTLVYRRQRESSDLHMNLTIKL